MSCGHIICAISVKVWGDIIDSLRHFSHVKNDAKGNTLRSSSSCNFMLPELEIESSFPDYNPCSSFVKIFMAGKRTLILAGVVDEIQKLLLAGRWSVRGHGHHIK